MRQQFTQKERDSETGLDYFGARYFASTQGRFTSADPLLASGTIDDPQSWNRYSYTLNNPLIYTDPLGLYTFHDSVTDPQREQFRKALSKARNDLWKIAAKYSVKSKEFKAAQRALNVYGAEGEKNGVTIHATTDLKADPSDTQTAGVPGRKTDENPNGQDIRITIRSDEFSNKSLDGLIGHEGSHAADGSEWVQSRFSDQANPTIYQTEFHAFTVESLLGEADYSHGYLAARLTPFKASGMAEIPGMNIMIWNSAWAEPDRAKLRAENIDVILRAPKGAHGYNVTPSSQGGPSLCKGCRFK